LKVLIEKWFDIMLALFGTLLGYLLAKRHIEHLMDGIVKTLDMKYLNLFRERAFHRAVSAMLPELPDFHLRQTNTFSTQTAHAPAADPAEDAVMGHRLTHGLGGRGHWSGHVRWGRRGRSTPSSLVCCTLSQTRH
jgi:hypothetical protein